MPSLLRASRLVLITGAVLCAAAALGPVWLVRIGVVLAVVTAVVAVGLAFRHIRAMRREHAARLLRVTRDHGAALTTERQRNAEVVGVLTDRARAAAERVQRQGVRIGELNAKVTELTGDNARLRCELQSRELTITGLRDTVRARESDLHRLRNDLDLAAVPSVPAPMGDVHGLPRRLRDQQRSGARPGDDTEPSVVIDMRAVQAAMPNLEVDQQRRHA